MNNFSKKRNLIHEVHMFNRPKVIRSGLNANKLLSSKLDILHLYADDMKMILVLEKLIDDKLFYYVKEANVRQTPLRYQSDMLGSDKVSTHDSESIKNVLGNLELRCSIALEPSKTIEDIIKCKIDPKDSHYELLLNPSRQEYFTRLFTNCEDFFSLRDILINAASKPQAGAGCSIL